MTLMPYKFYLIFMVSTRQTDVEQCKVYQVSIYGKALHGHTYKTAKVKGLFTCYVQCDRDPASKSCNFKHTKDICEINNQTKETKPNDFISDEQSYYIKRTGGFNIDLADFLTKRLLIGGSQLVALCNWWQHKHIKSSFLSFFPLLNKWKCIQFNGSSPPWKLEKASRHDYSARYMHYVKEKTELSKATFLSQCRKPELKILHVRRVVYPRFSTWSFRLAIILKNMNMNMNMCEKKLSWKTGHLC